MSRGGRSGRDNNSSLYLSGVTVETRADEIQELFEKYGKVRDVYIPRDYYTGEPRGFAYVQFFDEHSADDAYRKNEFVILKDQKMAVQWAKGSRKSADEMRRNTQRRSRRRSYSRSRSPRRRRSPSYDRRDRRRDDRGSRRDDRSGSRSRRDHRSRSGSRHRDIKRSDSRRRSVDGDRRGRSRSRSAGVKREHRDRSGSPMDAKRSPSHDMTRDPNGPGSIRMDGAVDGNGNGYVNGPDQGYPAVPY